MLALSIATACSVDGSGAGAGADDADEAASQRRQCHGPATAEAQSAVEPVAVEPEPELPVTYTDITGSDVVVEDVSRILALDSHGTLATTVHALGLGEHLVGRDISTGVPELMDLPVVTHSGHELNGEAILDLNPSVVLTDYSIGPLEVQLQLMDSDIPVVIMSDQRDRDQIIPQVEAVAEVLGVQAEGAQLATDLAADIAAAEARVEELMPPYDERLRIVFLYMRGNAGVYYWFGEGSGAAGLIDSLGGVDVASETGLEGMRPLNAEGLVSADPDLFLMMTKGLESVGGAPGLTEIPGVAETTAGLNGCVIDMDDHAILSFGPQFPATLEALAEAIYLEAAPA